MKARILFIPALLLGLTATAGATEYRFIAVDNSPETQMCVAAGSNKVTKLRMQFNEASGSPRYHANSIRCNDRSIAQFAHAYGADKAYDYLASHSRDKNRVIESVTIKDLSAAASQNSDEIVYIRVSSR
ncbi:DUF3718 domain-containing protein [Shewanella amazonensis]|uniref:DUF3718 domain-containing protein n=1 Tax=Shewanella amazonensis (strain ATCC BAA-1098 / SB2B) TaxID=326297 RepID=A1SAN1_SHEAM|nr:DUF3718 domain-containing protein [Shewanella amazonensis]ABM01438.1 hypothetical protein Sama_3235 [Shewanella amazonensis SB2B]